jgi:hypothetical protein
MNLNKRKQSFEKVFGIDGPVARYKFNLNVARGVRTPGLLIEDDRLVILEHARQAAITTLQRYNYTQKVFMAYCELGIEIYKLSGNVTVNHGNCVAQVGCLTGLPGNRIRQQPLSVGFWEDSLMTPSSINCSQALPTPPTLGFGPRRFGGGSRPVGRRDGIPMALASNSGTSGACVMLPVPCPECRGSGDSDPTGVAKEGPLPRPQAGVPERPLGE